MSNLSASLSMNSSLGPGKVRAMFQARRNGGASAQGSPVGWDKSYPLEPINKGTPPRNGSKSSNKRTPPGKATPPKKSGSRRPVAQPTVSGRGRKQGPRGMGEPNNLRKAKSFNNVSALGKNDKRNEKPNRSRSLNARNRSRRPSHRAEERNKINDEMRRREGEMLTKARGNTQKPAALQQRELRRSKQKAAKSPAPPANNKKNNNNLRADAERSLPTGAPRSRRNSFAPYKENKPPPSPAPRPPPTDPNMAQCPICTRAFAKDRLEKHKTICEKTNQKKRKAFDPVKMRMAGTESEQYIRKVKNTKPESEAPPKKSDWRKKHEEFVSNIRDAKKAQAHIAAGGDVRDLPTPKPAANDDYVQCPHCERRFNETAAERHIPKCSSISSNKGPGRGKGKRR